MNVSELIYRLQQLDPTATVVLADLTVEGEAAVSKLRPDEVRPLELGSFERGGMLIVEPWSANDPDGQKLDGPYPGVVLGEWGQS